jgi:hypothetical protein
MVWVPRAAIVVALLIVVASVVSACGGGSGSSDSGAGELAHQRELAEARREGAQNAGQSARIKQLERELHKVAAKKSEPAAAATAPPAEGQEPIERAESGGVGDWPGGTGFTAILASVSTEAEARSIQSEATGRGLDAGVLYSSEFSSLRPGYWVVFSGDFPNADGAEARAGHAQELGYADTYPRFVAR